MANLGFLVGVANVTYTALDRTVYVPISNNGRMSLSTPSGTTLTGTLAYNADPSNPAQGVKISIPTDEGNITSDLNGNFQYVPDLTNPAYTVDFTYEVDGQKGRMTNVGTITVGNAVGTTDSGLVVAGFDIARDLWFHGPGGINLLPPMKLLLSWSSIGWRHSDLWRRLASPISNTHRRQAIRAQIRWCSRFRLPTESFILRKLS